MRHSRVFALVMAAACGSKSPPPQTSKVDPESKPFEDEQVTGTRHANPPPEPEVPANAPAPAADPTASGLEKDEIRTTIRRAMTSIQYCYEKELLGTPDLTGKVTITFTVDPDGTVASASATGFNEGVEKCLVSVLKKLRFPAKAGSTTVNYPFIFQPVG